MSTLYEHYNDGSDDGAIWVYDAVWYAQTFTPAIAHKITSVKLKVWRTGSPGTVTVSIRATSGLHPTGGDLCVGTTDGDTLPDASHLAEWREITLGAGYNLDADTKYAIVVRAPSGDSSNKVNWRETSLGEYARGNEERSSGSGSSWISYTDPDCAFEDWGEPTITSPAVTALPASNVTPITARLNGEVTNNGGENPTVHIYWGTSDGETTPGDWDHDENLGVKAVDTFYKDISGLTRGTKYYYRCYAENSGGSAWSNAVEFTTLLEKPVAASNAATNVGVSAATLNGTATDDGGEDCQYRFRYKKAGGDYAYTDWIGAKATGETFSEGIPGLDASSTYYFNAQVKNSQFESDWGAELTFDTGAAVVAPTGTTDAATLVADVGATLNGTVTGDGGEACEVRFQYGLTAAYGTNTAWQPGKLTSDTFSQVISGLIPNTLYHFRAQIKNSDSTADGADETFTTEYFPTPFIRRVLRDMFGGGADINAGNPLPVDTSAGLKIATEILDEAEIIAGATTALGDCDAIDLSDGDRTLAITLEATYDGGATQGIKIHVRTSHDGTNWDTIDWDSWTPSFTAGATIRQTKHYDVSPYAIKVLVENLDGTKSVTDVKIIATVGP